MGVLYFVNLLLTLLHYGGTTYYACPPTSLCIPPPLCMYENVTFNAVEDNFKEKYEHSFVCGVFPECEGLICCNDPMELPNELTLNKSNWCYHGEQVIRSMEENEFSVPVHLYPGLDDNLKGNMDTEHSQNLICPKSSLCVPPHACSQSYITFSDGISTEDFSCGGYNETFGFVCCLITGVGKVTSNEESDVKPKFLMESEEKIRERRSFNFLAEGFLEGVENVKLIEKQPYEEITAKTSQPFECGRTLSISSELQRLYSPIGNRTAHEGDFPWHVAILSNTYDYMCSGVIIGEKTVVTIAHCFDKVYTDLMVRVGDLNLKYETETYPVYDVKVRNLFVHPQYRRVTLEADIAVLELKVSLRGLNYIRPACLPQSSYTPAINKCIVPGWGQYSKSREEKNEFSYALRAAPFYIISKHQCQNSLRKTELGAFFKLQNSVICAKGYSNSDTCKGDGGSGLVCKEKDIYVLKGLVSYGLGCGYNLPGVYTDVEKYLDFIEHYDTYGRKLKKEDRQTTYREADEDFLIPNFHEKTSNGKIDFLNTKKITYDTHSKNFIHSSEDKNYPSYQGIRGENSENYKKQSGNLEYVTNFDKGFKNQKGLKTQSYKPQVKYEEHVDDEYSLENGIQDTYIQNSKFDIEYTKRNEKSKKEKYGPVKYSKPNYEKQIKNHHGKFNSDSKPLKSDKESTLDYKDYEYKKNYLDESYGNGNDYKVNNERVLKIEKSRCTEYSYDCKPAEYEEHERPVKHGSNGIPTKFDYAPHAEYGSDQATKYDHDRPAKYDGPDLSPDYEYDGPDQSIEYGKPAKYDGSDRSKKYDYGTPAEYDSPDRYTEHEHDGPDQSTEYDYSDSSKKYDHDRPAEYDGPYQSKEYDYGKPAKYDGSDGSKKYDYDRPTEYDGPDRYTEYEHDGPDQSTEYDYGKPAKYDGSDGSKKYDYDRPAEYDGPDRYTEYEHDGPDQSTEYDYGQPAKYDDSDSSIKYGYDRPAKYDGPQALKYDYDVPAVYDHPERSTGYDYGKPAEYDGPDPSIEYDYSVPAKYGPRQSTEHEYEKPAIYNGHDQSREYDYGRPAEYNGPDRSAEYDYSILEYDGPERFTEYDYSGPAKYSPHQSAKYYSPDEPRDYYFGGRPAKYNGPDPSIEYNYDRPAEYDDNGRHVEYDHDQLEGYSYTPTKYDDDGLRHAKYDYNIVYKRLYYGDFDKVKYGYNYDNNFKISPKNAELKSIKLRLSGKAPYSQVTKNLAFRKENRNQ